jgi:hypothetical protein
MSPFSIKKQNKTNSGSAVSRINQRNNQLQSQKKSLYDIFELPTIEFRSQNSYGGQVIIEAVLLADLLE